MDPDKAVSSSRKQENLSTQAGDVKTAEHAEDAMFVENNKADIRIEQASSPTADMTPALGSLSVSHPGSILAQPELSVQDPTTTSNTEPISSSQAKSPPSLPSAFKNGKLSINRQVENAHKPPSNPLQSSFAQNNAVISPGSSHTKVYHPPTSPPPRHPAALKRLSASGSPKRVLNTSGLDKNSMEMYTDHVEIVDPQASLGMLADKMENPENAIFSQTIDEEDPMNRMFGDIRWDQIPAYRSEEIRRKKNSGKQERPTYPAYVQYLEHSDNLSWEEQWNWAKLGPGHLASKFQVEGPHHPHAREVWGIFPKTSKGASPEVQEIQKDLSRNFWNGNLFGWWFCAKCSKWFRMGADDLEFEDSPLPIAHSALFEKEFGMAVDYQTGGPDNGIASILSEKANKYYSTHPQAHHFHKVRDLFEMPLAPTVVLEQPEQVTLYSNHTLQWPEAIPCLSLSRCCQCNISVYYDAEPVMPGSFPAELLARVRDREPKPGQDSRSQYAKTLGALFRLLDDAITLTEPQASLLATGRTMRDIIGTDEVGMDLMARAGFVRLDVQQNDDGRHTDAWAMSTDSKTRAWKLRAWVELRIMLHQLIQDGTTVSDSVIHALIKSESYFTIKPLTNSLFNALRRAIARGENRDFDNNILVLRDIEESILYRQPNAEIYSIAKILGCYWSSTVAEYYSAYLAQVNDDPLHAPLFFQAFEKLSHIGFLDNHEVEQHRTNVALELSQGSAPPGDLIETFKGLGSSADLLHRFTETMHFSGVVGSNVRPTRAVLVDIIAEATEMVVKDDVIYPSDVYKNYSKTSQTEIAQALLGLAKGFHLPELLMVAEKLHKDLYGYREAAKKYQVSDPEAVDPEVWESLYMYSHSDATGQQLAEVEEDFRLIARQLNIQPLLKIFNIEAQNPKPSVPVPAGLYNIGNTCYLNSLLQYLHTLRDFREAIISLSKTIPVQRNDPEVILPRVGGRLLSLGEVSRARNFVVELAALFTSLSETTNQAVTPERNLAYLALVTASDELKPSEVPVGNPIQATSSLADSAPAQQLSSPSNPALPAIACTTSVETVLGKRTLEERETLDDTPLEEQTSTEIKDEIRQIRAIPMGRSASRSLSMEPSDAAAASELPSETDKPGSQNEYLPSATAMDVDESAVVMSPMEEPSNPLQGADAIKMPPPALPPRPHRASMNTDMMFGQQHDISECLDNVLFQVEAVILAQGSGEAIPAIDNMIKRLFFGRALQRIAISGDSTDLPPSLLSSQDVAFNSLYISVRDEADSDLYEKLQEVYFGTDQIEVDRKNAQKTVELQHLPPILQIQLERAQYDRELAKAYKSNAYVKFEEVLYMDRFLPDADPDKRAKTRTLTDELVKARAKLATLKESKPQSIASTLQTLTDALVHLQASGACDIDTDGLQGTLRLESERIEKEISDLEALIKQKRSALEEYWSTETTCEYELSSVFMHRGQAGFGHYWLYQRNLPDDPNTYYKFNDERVTSISRDEVLADTNGSNANPYLLVYVKKGAHMAQTVPIKPVATPLEVDMSDPELESTVAALST